jgi:DNA-binding NarL/FixJ family response regulator
MKSVIRIMLVDDHVMLREGLRDKFAAHHDIKVVAEAGTIAQALEQVEKHRLDVVVLDINLPDGSGLDNIRAIKKKCPKCKVMIVTMYAQERYATHALKQGADGYVAKGEPFEELLAALRRVSAGEHYVSATIARQSKERARHTGRAPGVDSLSPREFEVLTCLGRGMLMKQIAAQLDIGEKSVSTYQARLMAKLGVTTKVELLKYAVEVGIV